MKTLEALQKLDKETKAKVYIVGGFVRDFLRNKINNDLDIVIRKYHIEQIIKFLSNYGSVKKVKLSHAKNQFGMSIILFKAHGDTIEAQISLPKKGKTQKQHPTHSLKDDVKHRDFTINAMYLPINFKSKKDLIDLVGGQFSIFHRRIFAVGNPLERIVESPIRIMRAISLSARTGYTIDPFVTTTMKHEAKLLYKVPLENIRNELNKILLSKKPSKSFKLMAYTGILRVILPELDDCRGVKQDRRYHKWDVFHHCIYTADSTPEDLTLRLAGLLHDIGKPKSKKTLISDSGEKDRLTFHKHEIIGHRLANKILTHLKYNNKLKTQVLDLIKNHMYHYIGNVYCCTNTSSLCTWRKAVAKTDKNLTTCPICGSPVVIKNGWTDSSIRRFIANTGMTESDIENPDTFPLFILRSADRKGNGFKDLLVTDKQKDFQNRIKSVFKSSKALKVADLDIDGTDLMNTFNLSQSPKIGTILSYLLDQVIEHPHFNNKLDLLKLSTEFLFNKGITY